MIRDMKTHDMLLAHLSTLFPEVPKGRYIGTGQAHDCGKNAFRYSKKHNLDLYVGFLFFPDTAYGWRAVNHCFNVENGLVVEVTDLSRPSFDWSNYVYFGSRVPRSTLLRDLWSFAKP